MVHNSMNEDDSKGFIKFGLALSIIAGLSFWGKQEFFSSATLDSHMEDTYPHTYVGRRLANQEDMRKRLFSVNELWLIQYREQFFVVNKDLNLLGTNEFFQVVTDLEERGKKYQILEEDMIPFSTIINNGQIQFTLLNAYEMVEQRNPEVNFFPMYEEIDFPLNEDPMVDGMNFARNMNLESPEYFYHLSTLYVVNLNGNMYLCQEDCPGKFSVLYNGMNRSTFSFSIGEDVSKWQVQKFTKLLEERGFSYDGHASFSLLSCYQLLETAHHMNPISFTPSYSSYCGFTKSQLQHANQYLSYGENYLDDYHLDSCNLCRMYSFDDVKIVILGGNQFVLASSVVFDEEQNIYSIVPLQSSSQSFSPICVSGNVSVIPFGQFFDIPDIDMESAHYFYTLFRDFLVKNGPSFSVSKGFMENEFQAASILDNLSRKLHLKLTYEE